MTIELLTKNTIFFDEKDLFWAGTFSRDPVHGDYFVYDRLWLTNMKATMIFDPAEGCFRSYTNKYTDSFTQDVFQRNGYLVTLNTKGKVANVRTAMSLIQSWHLVDEKQLFMLRLKYR